MTLRAVILLKSREIHVMKLNRKKTSFKFQDGLYVISPGDINNIEVNKKIIGAEILFHEGNPNAVNLASKKDQSDTFLSDLVIANALKQTAHGPRFQISNILEFFKPLTDPVNLMYILFVGIIIYGLLAGALGWV